MGRRKTIAELRERTKVEAATLVRGIADPSVPGESVKMRIARAAKRLGWTYQRTEDIWRREARIEVFEIDQLRNWRPEP